MEKHTILRLSLLMPITVTECDLNLCILLSSRNCMHPIIVFHY
jgi:hypothetical protein